MLCEATLNAYSDKTEGEDDADCDRQILEVAHLGVASQKFVHIKHKLVIKLILSERMPPLDRMLVFYRAQVAAG